MLPGEPDAQERAHRQRNDNERQDRLGQDAQRYGQGPSARDQERHGEGEPDEYD